jgi:hypothetical protein
MFVECIDFRPLERNTLRGFAKIRVPDWNLIFDGVAIHEKDGRTWAQLPARPMLDANGYAVQNDAGKIQYARMSWFDDREAGDRFSAAVIAAVAAFDG